jgi:hypothetical protein
MLARKLSWRIAIAQIATEFLGLFTTTRYDAPSSFRQDWPLPRRALVTSPDILSGGGMNGGWRRWYVFKGVVPRIRLLRYAFPEELADNVDRPWRWILRLVLKRHGEHASETATNEALTSSVDQFPQSITQENPVESRTSRWLAHRLLNGMLPCYLRTTEVPDTYRIAFDWDDLHFRPGSPYFLPNVEAQLSVRGAHSQCEDVDVDWLEFRYRESDGAHSDPLRVVMSGPNASSAWLRERARWTFCSTYLMAAEIDRHIVMGHFVTEFADVAVRKWLSSGTNPIRRLILPHTQRVDVANHIGDALVWGDYGLMVLGSALEAKSLHNRFATRLGAFDWKGFEPNRKCVAQAHYAPAVQGLFWDELCEYTNSAFDQLRIDRIFPIVSESATSDERSHASELQAFVTGLSAESVQGTLWDGLDCARWFDASEFRATPSSKALSPIQTLDDLKQYCRFIIYCGTLGHGWANIRQYDEGGEPAYAAFGLRARLDEPGPDQPTDDSAWRQRAEPRPCDVANQLIQGFTLSFLEVETFGNEFERLTAGASAEADLDNDPIRGSEGLASRIIRRVKPQVDAALITRLPAWGDRRVRIEDVPVRPNA